MRAGILKEIKSDENRMALTPGGVEVMRQNGHQILVEKNARRGAQNLDTGPEQCYTTVCG